MSRTTVPALAVVIVSLSLLTGCASYTTPGRGADMAAFGGPSEAERRAGTAASMQRHLDKKPLAAFPTAIALARVQAPGYRSLTNAGWGTGRYSVVTSRDVEKEEHVERLGKLPLVRGIAPLGRLLLDPDLQSDEQLREAAAKLHADMLLIYTIDTTFTTEDKIKPLSVVTLGLSPNQQVRIGTTASAVLLDTRNGYVYGLAEASEKTTKTTNAWQTDTAADEARRDIEAKAFEKLVGELEKTWAGVIKQYAGNAAAKK